jgi:formylglycine-generating enzyme required for sulfatase activity
MSFRDVLDRGIGPAPVGTARQGVNSESVDSKVTAGGSWWYEAFRMHRDDRAVKSRDTAVVYIGCRCAPDVR